MNQHDIRCGFLGRKSTEPASDVMIRNCGWFIIRKEKNSPRLKKAHYSKMRMMWDFKTTNSHGNPGEKMSWLDRIFNSTYKVTSFSISHSPQISYPGLLIPQISYSLHLFKKTKFPPYSHCCFGAQQRTEQNFKIAYSQFSYRFQHFPHHSDEKPFKTRRMMRFLAFTHF